jgi:hypothetical protein
LCDTNQEQNFFWSANRGIKKYIKALRIDNAISALRISIKQDSHDITEILLKVALNTITPPI